MKEIYEYIYLNRKEILNNNAIIIQIYAVCTTTLYVLTNEVFWFYMFFGAIVVYLFILTSVKAIEKDMRR